MTTGTIIDKFTFEGDDPPNQITIEVWDDYPGDEVQAYLLGLWGYE